MNQMPLICRSGLSVDGPTDTITLPMKVESGPKGVIGRSAKVELSRELLVELLSLMDRKLASR